MKIKKNTLLSFIIFFMFTAIISLLPVEQDSETNFSEQIEEKNDEETPTISFNYENEDLINILNHFATLKDINLILPPGEPLNTKVTLHIDEKITLNQAWNLLYTLLDAIGFSMVPRGKMVQIVRSNTKDVAREPMPTYIGVHPNDLPENDQPIRYLYYLSNIKVSDSPENELNGIVRDLLPENTYYKADAATNSLLLIAKSNDIRGVMKIIIELDHITFQEKVDIIPLNHTSATIVAQLLTDQLLKTENINPYRLDTKKPKEVPYFSGFTKVIPEERLNKLILLGRSQAVERLKDFIKRYIDVPPDTGNSILHVYPLQYLDAAQLAIVLNSIVEGSRVGGPSQARGEKQIGGVERFFDQVIIYADKPRESEEARYSGGNKLVVAARNDDWKQIKRLIEELDTPQPQVLIEILIADLSVDDVRLLGAMTRTPNKVPLPDQFSFQSPQLAPPIPNTMPNPQTLNSDLLQNAYTENSEGNVVLANPFPGSLNVATAFASAGTTMLSLNDNDGKTWSILELQQAFSSSKILSHPHVIATNNKKATVVIGEQRLLQDAASGSQGGSTIVQNKEINADLKVSITPRISAADTINLQVLIDINEFLIGANTQNAQTIRKLETNANIKSGGIFALGGLIKDNLFNTVSETPLLGKIPILGWFFKRRNSDSVRNNLTVFICPTIIKPRLIGGLNKHTRDYININKEEANGAMFDSLRDPITRWFFKTSSNPSADIDEFVEANAAYSNPPSTHQLPETTSKIVTTQNTTENLDMLKLKLQNEPNPFIQA